MACGAIRANYTQLFSRLYREISILVTALYRRSVWHRAVVNVELETC